MVIINTYHLPPNIHHLFYRKLT